MHVLHTVQLVLLAEPPHRDPEARGAQRHVGRRTHMVDRPLQREGRRSVGDAAKLDVVLARGGVAVRCMWGIGGWSLAWCGACKRRAQPGPTPTWPILMPLALGSLCVYTMHAAHSPVLKAA